MALPDFKKPAGSPALPDNMLEVAVFLNKDANSIQFNGIEKNEYSFTAIKNGHKQDYKLSLDSLGNIQISGGLDENGKPLFRYINAARLPEVREWFARTLAAAPIPVDNTVKEEPKQPAINQPAVAKEAAQVPTQTQATTKPAEAAQKLVKMQTDKEPEQEPKETVRPYATELGYLHELAKWAAKQGNAIYEKHPKPGYSKQYKVAYEKLAALIQLESTFDPNEVSYTGCTGLGQFCKKTYDGVIKDYDLKTFYPAMETNDRKDPPSNMLATAVHLAENLNFVRVKKGKSGNEEYRVEVKGDYVKAYIIHNLGEPQGVKFLRNLDKDPDKTISNADVDGVNKNPGLYRDRGENGKAWGEWKTYKEAYNFIEGMLSEKEKSAQHELNRAEAAAKAKEDPKKAASIDIGDDLKGHLTANVSMIEREYNHPPTSGPRGQTQIT